MRPSAIGKHSIAVAGHKTSVSLEIEFWESLREIAGGRDESLSQLVQEIDAERKFANLSSAIRLFVLRYYRNQLDEQSKTVAPLDLDASNSIEPGA